MTKAHLPPATRFPRLFTAACLGWLLMNGAPVASVCAQSRARTEVAFPDLPGFKTLRCDFHMHTVYSDGDVWPTLRAEEAWRQGLDAFAMTDHIEYLPHTNDLPNHYGRSFDLVRPTATSLGLVAIRGGEITRGEPPGHWNALFLTNIAAVFSTNDQAGIRAAAAQGAFIFWNHPGWKQPNQKSVWYPAQEAVFQQGLLHGLEIVNGEDYDPIAHQWCLDRNLTLLGNSDTHQPILMEYDYSRGEHRPMTLVFARERTVDSIKEALFARRTVVYAGNRLFGAKEFLEPLFQQLVQILNPEPTIKGKGRALIQVRNRSPVAFALVTSLKTNVASVTKRLTLPAGKVALLEVYGTKNATSGLQEIRIPLLVTNLMVTPKEALTTELKLNVTFVPAGQ